MGVARSRAGRLTKERDWKNSFPTTFFVWLLLLLFLFLEVGFYSVAQVTCWLSTSGDFPISVSQVWELQA